MERRFTLEGGGQLEVREEGAQVHLSVRRGLDGAGLYKVWVRGDQGELMLGTLIPDGRYLRLERTMSRDSLAAGGCWPIAGGKTVLAFTFSQQEEEKKQADWRWEHRPSLRLHDPVLREAAAAWGSMLIREDQRGFQLAAPLDPYRPFPITPLFCFGQPVRVDGQTHVAFSFDVEGNPRAPEQS